MNRYDDLAAELPYDRGVEVLVVIRRPDGTETEAAVLHHAGVVLERAADEPEPFAPWETRIRTVPASVMQIRVTATTATVYAPDYFNRNHRQIDGGTP